MRFIEISKNVLSDQSEVHEVAVVDDSDGGVVAYSFAAISLKDADALAEKLKSALEAHALEGAGGLEIIRR